jgi:hypothetical protein
VTRYLYLHGFASGPGSKKAAFFRRRFHEAGIELRVPDLADGDFENLTITAQLRVIEREAAGEPVRLIGSSMGGYLAALYAERHPETERMVLLAPAFGFVRRWPDTFGAPAFEEWKRTGYMDVFHYGEQRTRRLSFALYRDAEQYAAYPDAAAPCLIFQGISDEVVPAAHAREFVRLHPATQLELVDDGHELMVDIERICLRALAFLS